jgi:hypothetical protein
MSEGLKVSEAPLYQGHLDGTETVLLPLPLGPFRVLYPRLLTDLPEYTDPLDGSEKVFLDLEDGPRRVATSKLLADLPEHTDPLAGSETAVMLLPAGPRRVAYSRLWKSATRQVVTLTTGVLAQGETETGVVPLGVVFEALYVTLSAAARLRLYSTAAARSADASRPYTTRAAAGSGLILEVRSSAALDQALDPHAHGANFETVPTVDIPYAVQNLGAAGAVTVIFTVIDRG